MSDPLIREIRESRAEMRNETRQIRRQSAIDGARRGLPLPDIKYTQEEVTNIAEKLKCKGSVSKDDLQNLMYALGEHPDHVSTFFKVVGALQGLTREFTGSDASKQILAAGCLCNLSLGPPRSCQAVSNAAGTYLITYLQNWNGNLVELCAWSLGNLYASCEKVAKVLTNQGLLDHLMPLIDNNVDSKIVDAVFYALGQILSSKWNTLSTLNTEELLSKILISTNKSENTFWVLYLLSCKETPINLSKSILNLALTELSNRVNTKGINFDVVIINHLIRISANVSCKETIYDPSVLEILNSEYFVSCINNILLCHFQDLKKECLWLVGNVFSSLEPNNVNGAFFTSLSPILNSNVSQ